MTAFRPVASPDFIGVLAINYYHRHLGDYARDTGKLTQAEHGAYNLLLDSYYVTEQGIPADEVYRVGKANTKPERAAVNFVLKKFFRLVSGVWIKDRCQEEIVASHKRIEQARLNGRSGGRPKNPAGTHGDTGREPSGFDSGSIPLTARKALQSPVSNLQEEEKNPEAKNGLSRNRTSELNAGVMSLAGNLLTKESRRG